MFVVFQIRGYYCCRAKHVDFIVFCHLQSHLTESVYYILPRQFLSNQTFCQQRESDDLSDVTAIFPVRSFMHVYRAIFLGEIYPFMMVAF